MSASSPRERRGWIFDLDGTLTRPQHDFAAMRDKLGIPAGAPILEYIAAQPKPRRTMMNLQLDQLERVVAERARINEGADALIQSLAARGARLGIFTRNRRIGVEIALQRIKLAPFFAPEDIVACEDALPKPDPAGIQSLLRRWRLSGEEVVMVGDFRYDLEAGRRAGCFTVHLARDEEPGWPSLTDLRVATLTDLLP